MDQKNGKDKKELIVETAKKLFAEKGYAATGLREISEQSNVSIGNIYNYFKNKKEIYDYMAEPEKIFASLSELPELLKEDFPYNLDRIIKLFKDKIDSNKDLYKLIFIDLIEFNGEKSNKGLETLVEFGRKIFQENVDMDKISKIMKDIDYNFYIKSYLIILVSYFLVTNILPAASIDEYSNEELSKNMANIILHGILK